MSHHAVRKLHIRCGHNRLPGWLNIDRDPTACAVYLHAAELLPSEDGAFDYVFSEHLTLQQGQALLDECHRRVLKRGGRVRTVTHELDKILKLRQPTGAGREEGYVRWITEGYCGQEHSR